MATGRNQKPSKRAVKEAVTARPSPSPRKRAKNLSLSPDAIAHGEAYSRQYGTTLSELVGDFLRALPLGEAVTQVSPAVRRLYGAAAKAHGSTEDGAASLEGYREHLYRKYGNR